LNDRPTRLINNIVHKPHFLKLSHFLTFGDKLAGSIEKMLSQFIKIVFAMSPLASGFLIVNTETKN